MKPSTTKVSLIIPTYNEIARIPKKLKKIKRFIERTPSIHEVIFVDDGSTDTTAKYIGAFIAGKSRYSMVSYTKNKGKGYALCTGFNIATGNTVVFMDADISVPLEEIHTLLALGRTYDVVIGSRKKGIKPEYSTTTKKRAYLSTLGIRFRKHFLLEDIEDTQCGFKLFSAPIAKHIASRATIYGYGCDMEFLTIAKKYSATIYEVAVPWRHSAGGNLHTIPALFKALCSIGYTIFYIALRAKLGFYKP